MKISPTAIRQKAFETSFRGYEKKQVSDFLEEMSVVMEQINQENLELRSRLQQVEGEAKRLKDVEDSLFRTLKTAEDTGAAIITEATEAADQIIGEANQIAEQTTREAQRYAEQLGTYSQEQARVITQAAEENAKETTRVLAENIKGLIKSYEGLVEQREALVKSLRRLSQDALNQIELSETHFSRIDAKAFQIKAEELSRSNYFSAANAAALASTASPSVVQREEVSTPPRQEDPQPEMNEEQVASTDSEEFIETGVESAAESTSFVEEELVSEIYDGQEDEVEESAIEAAQEEEEFEEEEEDEDEEDDEVSDEDEEEEVEAFVQVQERKGKSIFDEDAFKSKYADIYSKFTITKSTVKGTASFAGAKGFKKEISEFDPALGVVVERFSPLVEKIAAGKETKESLHGFSLELRRFNAEALWEKLKAENSIKVACGTHAGIEGVFKWARTEKVTESLDKKALKEAHPDLVAEFTTQGEAVKAVIVDPKKGY